MLQDIRANAQGTVAKVIVGLIVIAFSFFGIESILLGGSTNAVAEVNGEEITPQALQLAVNTQKRQLLSMMGDNIMPELLDDERLTQLAMQSLIQRKLMVQSAQSMGLTISDAQIGAIVGGMEEFQLDGQFSPEMYRARLSDAGFTPASFKQTMNEDLITGQARSGLAASEFATPAELALNARIVAEQRDIRYITIPLSSVSFPEEVSQEDIAAFYEENAESFMSTEAVTLDYIRLQTEDYTQPVQEELVLQAYETEIRAGQYGTENRVAHILFEQGGDETDEAFQARIATVSEKLDAGGDFAELAGEFSDDVGSSGFGGDLGLSSGDAFPEAMEAAISELAVGEVSGPVITEAGTHLVLLKERREGKAPPLEELRPRLERQIAMSEARVELLRNVETLKDLAFNADNLKDPAAELGLETAVVERVTRDQQEGLFSDSRLIEAAFSDDVLNAGHNSDVIELDPDTWLVLRVQEHHEAEVKPLQEVSEQIAAAIEETRARDAVRAAAEQAVGALRTGDSVEGYATEAGYAWQVELGAERRSPVVPPAILTSAFRLAPPGTEESVVDYVVADSGDGFVFEVARVTPGDLEALPEPEITALSQSVSGEYGQIVDTEYQQGLRESADINVL